MKEVARTNDPVFMSFIKALLNDAEIEHLTFDGHTAFAEGSISAIQQRLMVLDEDYEEASNLIKQAEKDWRA